MMLTFLELTRMVDATQHDGVGWGMMLKLTFLELGHMVNAQNTTRLSERTSKNFEDLSQNAKTQVVSAFTKSGLSS